MRLKDYLGSFLFGKPFEPINYVFLILFIARLNTMLGSFRYNIKSSLESICSTGKNSKRSFYLPERAMPGRISPAIYYYGFSLLGCGWNKAGSAARPLASYRSLNRI
jgi:hypothetical protein